MGFVESWKWEDYASGNNVPDGTYDVKIDKVGQEVSNNGKRFLKIALKVNTPSGVLGFTQQMYESEYFNKFYSRYIDCFEIPHVQWSNFAAHIGKKGKAKFSHKLETITDRQTGEQRQINRCVMEFLVDDAVYERSAGVPANASTQNAQPAASKPAAKPIQPQPAPGGGTFDEDIPF